MLFPTSITPIRNGLVTSELLTQIREKIPNHSSPKQSNEIKPNQRNKNPTLVRFLIDSMDPPNWNFLSNVTFNKTLLPLSISRVYLEIV